MFKRSTRRLAFLGTMLVLGAACQDLAVPNLNTPDRARALAQPGDLLSLMGSGFAAYFTALHGNTHVNNLFPQYATEMYHNTNIHQFGIEGAEPRGPYNNSPTIPTATGPQGPRHFWRLHMISASISYDGLRTLDELGIVLEDQATGADVTPMARASAKLIQGMSWGYLATMYDRVVIFPETMEIGLDPGEQWHELLLPAGEALARALTSLEEAATIAQANTFTFPNFPLTPLWFGTPTPLTNQDIFRIANHMMARLLVLYARTPEDRKDVDWARVLDLTSVTKQLTKNWEATLASSGLRTSGLMDRMQNNTTGMRWDNKLIGQADVSGTYQEWIASPLSERNRFNIVTPDRRITGNTPTSNGTYSRYKSNDNGFGTAPGTYQFSAYQWARHAIRVGASATATGNNTGTALLATVDESNLLRAEALLRTGDLAGAAALINITRTRSHLGQSLPPVTVAGVPQSATCVPRTDSGACGDLMVALRYERMIEGAGLDAVRGYLDSRGFGLLPDGSWLQAPIPGGELEAVGLEVYTFGGVGTEWGATYHPVTMADL